MTRRFFQWSFALMLTLPLTLFASEIENRGKLWPAPLVHLDQYFSHHVLVAEKSTHKVYLFENRDSFPELVATYQMASGKKAGNKMSQGDYRTPEGIYFITDFIPRPELLKRYGTEGEIYGVGAFVMDYPNPMDQGLGKTGGGIWLHSTNDETRIDKGLDSRGCIVTANADLIGLSKYIELNRTNIIVVQDLHFLNEDSWRNTRTNLNAVVSDWLKAWQDENVENYLSHYHPQEFHDPFRGSYQGFSKYKRAVFANAGKPSIDIKHLSIMRTGSYAVVTFKQFYDSETIKDVGRKTLYLKRDASYNWKIVSERWSKTGIENDRTVAFRPSDRFFKSDEQQSKN